MSWQTSDMNYKYSVEVDLTDFIDSVVSKLRGELIDVDIDGETLTLLFEDRGTMRHYYCPATMLDPPEYDMELIDVITEKEVNEAVGEFGLSANLEIDEEDFEVLEDDEPDPDLQPGGWDTRFEG